MSLRQREPRWQCRALLDAVYQLPCLLQIPGVCEGGNGEPCHANWSDFGKGKSRKAHDCFVAAGCRACHREIDHGKRLTREEREAMWMCGWRRTILELFRRGLVRVDTLSVVSARMLRPVDLGPPRVSLKPRKFTARTGHRNGASTRSPSKIYRRQP